MVYKTVKNTYSQSGVLIDLSKLPLSYCLAQCFIRNFREKHLILLVLGDFRTRAKVYLGQRSFLRVSEGQKRYQKVLLFMNFLEFPEFRPFQGVRMS